MTKEIKELEKAYFEAVKIKDWKTARELNNKITEKQNEILYQIYWKKIKKIF